MATFNGDEYLSEQIDSIIRELHGYEYELIIVDDCSTDDTVKTLEEYAELHSEVKIYQNKINLGHVKTFERALNFSSGDYIFLADQDDIWIYGRVALMLESLDKSTKSIIFSGLFFFNDRFGINDDLLISPPVGKNKVLNILKIFFGRANYWGCSILLKKEFLGKALPFNQSVESHDIWMALVGLIYDELESMKGATIYHRTHSRNKTSKKRRSLAKIFVSRCQMLIGVFFCVFNK